MHKKPAMFEWIRVICQAFARGSLDEEQLANELALYERDAPRFGYTVIPDHLQKDAKPTERELWDRKVIYYQNKRANGLL